MLNRDKIFSHAKEIFGTTNDIMDAGFLLPDGTLLDFNRSGRERESTWQGGFTGIGMGCLPLDHSNINFAYDDIDTAQPDYHGGYNTFLDMGAIRVSPYKDGEVTFESRVIPTEAQLKLINKSTKDSKEGFLELQRPLYGKGITLRKAIEPFPRLFSRNAIEQAYKTLKESD